MAGTKYPKRITLPLTQAQYDRLAEAAKATDRSVVWLLRRCVEHADLEQLSAHVREFGGGK